MRSKVIRLILRTCGSCLAGILLVLAFPRYDFTGLAWVGLVPLLLSLNYKNKSYSFLLSLLTGIIFIGGIFNWILVVSGYKLYHHAILVFYLALYFGFFGLIFTFLAKRLGQTFAFLSGPFVWVALEYFRSNLSFLALPWALLSHSQHQYIPVIQIASITGSYGISFLIVLVNSVLAINIIGFLGRLGWLQLTIADLPTRKEISLATLITIALITITLVYGRTTVSKPKNAKSIKISVLQGDIEQSKKWDPIYAKTIMKTYTDLSREAAKDKPVLIVWPESATPGFILKKMTFLNQMNLLIRETKVHYLIGSSEYPKFQKVPIEYGKGGNSAVFFSPESKVLGQYFKRYLVPFVEYIPFEESFKWPSFIVPEGRTSWEIEGKEFTLFEINGAKFGVVICWESLFPDQFRQFVKKGANFMLNISSEAWFGISAFQYQILAATKLRAVENRTFIARAGNYTISCFIDPYGRIVDRVTSEEDGEIFVRGVLTGTVIPMQEDTIYTRHGDWFAWLSIGVSLIFLVIALLKKVMHGYFRY